MIDGNLRIEGDGTGYIKFKILSEGTETVIYTGNLVNLGTTSNCADSDSYIFAKLRLNGNRHLMLNIGSGGGMKMPKVISWPYIVKVFYR